MPFAKTIRWPRSLRARLLAMFVTGIVLSAAVVAVAVMLLAPAFSRHMLASGIVDYTEAIARNVRFDAEGRPVGVDENKIEPWLFYSLDEEVVVRLFDAQGRIVYAPDPDPQPLAPDGEAFDLQRRAFAFTHNGVAMHAATVPFDHRGRRWYAQFATSDRLVLRMRESIGMPALRHGIAATCLGFLLLFMVTIHWTLRRALDPLRDASRAAQRITPRSLDQRLDVLAQPTEIRPLVMAFNQTLDRLQHGFRTQQEFLSNAAHELKTPLALVRAQVEAGPRDERQRVLLQDLDLIARQVQQLLMLAEVSEHQNFRIARLDPRAAVQECFEFMGRVADQHGVRLGLRFEGDVRGWEADRGALFTLLKNLMENAIQHSPAGAVVALTVRPEGFTVSDEGPGVPPRDLPRIFDRFWRGAQRRDTGAGLGLSICAEIAAAHGWRLEARCPDRGLEVHVQMQAPSLRLVAAPITARVQGRATGAQAVRAALF